MNGKILSLLFCCLIWKSSGKPANVFLSYQDSLGQYSFGYSAPGSARSEVKTLNGDTRGAYSYVDDNGVIQSAEYVAGDDGFHVIATNLPQAPLPVEETAEVSAARKEHLEAFQLAEQMAEESGNEEEGSFLSKGSVDQSDRSEIGRVKVDEEGQEGSKVSEEIGRMEEVSKNDNKALNPKEAETAPSEESTSNISNVSSLKDRLHLDNVPVFRITYGNQQSEKKLAIEQGSNGTTTSTN